MTFCLGISVQDGLVALADTRVVKGDEQLSKGKLELIEVQGQPLFIMTSGLRSVRDKTIIYLKEWLAAQEQPLARVYQVANAYGACLRRVRDEDGAALERDGLHFNSHAIIGGRLQGDALATMYYLYPAGNWIEVNPDSPYFLIGRTSYGKPILDRLLTHTSSLAMSVNLGYLAFDATCTSVSDVDFPVDILIYDSSTGRYSRHSFLEQELHCTRQWWRASLAQALAQMPVAWAEPLFTAVGVKL